MRRVAEHILITRPGARCGCGAPVGAARGVGAGDGGAVVWHRCPRAWVVGEVLDRLAEVRTAAEAGSCLPSVVAPVRFACVALGGVWAALLDSSAVVAQRWS